MTLLHKIGLFCFMMSSLSWGCATSSHTQTDQENLGQGIVLGSMAEQHKHQAVFASWPSSFTVKGQVSKIEGAAYLVTTVKRGEIRLPVDQETTIDRPAHIGDWILAYTDEKGRALQIRNIDEEILVEEH